MTRSALAASLGLAVAVTAAGCGANAPDAGKPTVIPPQVKAWQPYPAVVPILTVPVRVGGYELLLPTGYTELAAASRTTDKIVAKTYKAAEHQILFSTTVITDKKTAAESTDHRKFMPLFLAGQADGAGLTIREQDKPDVRALAGLQFGRVIWAGKTRDDQPVEGSTYAAVDGDALIVLQASRIGSEGFKAAADLDSAVATLHKK